MLWDIFCRVIDNHGDIGVAWRLAADLALRGERVRLWVDDPSALDWMAPEGRDGVQVVQVYTAHAGSVKTPYDAVRDFAWITTIVSYPFVLTARNELPAKSAGELIALMKKNPGKLNYGSVGQVLECARRVH